MAYLNCARCGFSMRSRDPLRDRHFCPRCSAHGNAQPLFRSRVPLRHLAVGEAEQRQGALAEPEQREQPVQPIEPGA